MERIITLKQVENTRSIYNYVLVDGKKQKTERYFKLLDKIVIEYKFCMECFLKFKGKIEIKRSQTLTMYCPKCNCIL